jgi:hypothetical protein
MIVELPISRARALAVATCQAPSCPGLRSKAWDHLKREKQARDKDARPCDTNPPEDAA